WSFNPILAESANGSWSGIGENNVSIRIRDCLIAEGALQRLQRSDIADERIRHLLQSVEVIRAARRIRQLSRSLRELAQDVRSVGRTAQVNGAGNRRPREF